MGRLVTKHDKITYSESELKSLIYEMAKDLGIEKSEFSDSSKIIDTFLLSYLLANVEDIADLWNDEEE